MKSSINQHSRASTKGWRGLLTILLGLCGSSLAFGAPMSEGNYLHFDGTTSGYTISPSFAGFPSTNLTIEFWARSSDLTKNGGLFSYGAGGDANTFLIYNHQNLTVWIRNVSTVPTGVSLTDGQWHHVAVTWSISGALQVFKDGDLAFSTNHQAGAQLGNNGVLVLGQDQDFVGGGFDPFQAFLGDLDEVRIWSVIRTPEQIGTNRNTVLIGATDTSGNTAEPGLVAYYRFDEGVGTVAHDAAAHGHDANLGTGTVWLSRGLYNAGSALELKNGSFGEIDTDTPAYPQTYSLWLRTSNAPTGTVLLARDNTVQGQVFRLSLDSQSRLSGRFDGAAGFVIATDSGPFSDARWHHVAYAVDDSGARLFVDGILKSKGFWTGSPGSPATGAINMSFITIEPNTGSGTSVQVDELNIWGLAWDGAGIQNLMLHEHSFNEPYIAIAYNFNQGSGNFFGLLSGNFQWIPSGARIQNVATLSGKVHAAGIGLPNIPVTALQPPSILQPVLPIPDAGTVTSTNYIGLTGLAGLVRVSVSLDHPFAGDLELTLIHPDGTEVRLKNSDPTDGRANWDAAYPDTTQPAQSLNAFNGRPITGAWRLRVRDAYALDTGLLKRWSLQFGSPLALTDANGNYLLSDLIGISNYMAQTYTVAPVKNGFVFNPPSILTAPNSSDLNFELISGFVSGRVVNHIGNGFTGVTVTSGPAVSTTTDTNGNYRLSPLPPGNTTVAVSLPGHTFSPSQLLNVPLGTTNADFAVSGYPVSGRITDSQSNGVEGVVVSTTDLSVPIVAATSDSHGDYVIVGVPPGNQTITPFKSGVGFSPPNQPLDVQAAIAGVDFAAVQSPPTITAISNQVISKNGSTGALRFDVNDGETRPVLLQVSATSSNPTLVPAANIALGGVGVQRTVTVTPALNQVGTADITIIVTDESGLSASNTFSLRVNQPPQAGVGLALNFGGQSNWISAGTNIIFPKGTFTVETWALAPSNAGPRTALSQGAAFTLGIDAAGKIRIGTNWNTGVSYPFGDWHHFALVRDSDDTHLYIDGVLSATKGSSLPFPLAADSFKIGSVANGEFWVGAVDEVRVWRQARTAAEIASNRRVRVTGDDLGLAALWHFDELGATAPDSSHNSRNLVVSGASRIASQLVFDAYVTRLGLNINDTLQGFDADGDPITYAIATPPVRGTVTLSSPSSGAFVYTADSVGDDEFAFTVSDPYITSSIHRVSINVLPDTNAPSISFIPDQAIQEDTVMGPVAFTVTDSERTANQLPIFAHCSDPTLVPDANIVIAGTGTNRTISLVPATNRFGSATITLTTSDGSQQATASFALAVAPVNDAPLIQPIPKQILAYGQAYDVFFNVSDVDNDIGSLSYSASSSNEGLVGALIDGDDAVWIYAGGASGTVTVTLRATDGSATNSITFQVQVNDPPKIAPIPAQTIYGSVPRSIGLSLTDVDSPASNAVITAVSSNPTVVESAGLALSGTGANRTLVITSNGGRSGSTTITLVATDGISSSSISFLVTVKEPINYEVIELPNIAGAERGLAQGLNDKGQIVGWCGIGTSPRAVLWDINGVVPTVTTLLNSDSIANAINNSGWVVGRNNYYAAPVGFLYANGNLTSLGLPGVGLATDINDAGQVIGGYWWTANIFFFHDGTGDTYLTNVFYPRSFAGEQRNLRLNDLGDVLGVDPSLTHPVVWVLDQVTGARSLVDLGAFAGSASILVGGINNNRQVAVNRNPGAPIIYNYQTAKTNADLASIFSPLFPGQSLTARDMNDLGDVVGSAGGGVWLYSRGEAFNVGELMAGSGIYPSELRGINSFGDITGYGSKPGVNGIVSFVLRRQWFVGQPISPPAQAFNGNRVFSPPNIRALDGTSLQELAQAFVWSDYEQKLFFVRPIQVEVSWATSTNLFDTNAVAIVQGGRVVWPASPQLHVAGAPADAGPVDVTSPYRPIGISFSTAIGANLDASTRTFNSVGAGYTVIRYLIAPEVALGGSPDPLTHSNYFEVARTVSWNDPLVFRDGRPAVVGTKVTDPRGPEIYTNSFKSGWTVINLAPYDGAGQDRAYDRTTQTGPIIPVNRDTASTNDDLVVAFYKKNTLTRALWPDLAARFSITWPGNAQPLVIADQDGSGPLPDSQYPNQQVYDQPDRALPGFNPNEEHAFLAPTSAGQGLFALRNDLNRPNTSESYVLLKYRNPTNSEWQFKVYRPVLTDPTHVFTFNGTAGQEISPPHPVGFFTLCQGTTNISGTAFRDYKGKYYASRGPTPTDLNPQIVMRYFYPLQAGFYYDLDGNGTNDLPIGSCVLWSAIPPGNAGSLPVDVTYRIRWPDAAPTLEIGETLLEPKRGLPGIKDWASAQVVYDSLNTNGSSPLTNTARLYDPLSPRVLRITNLVGITAGYQFPPEIALQTVNGKQIFSGLPYHLRTRLSYDPVNKAISFAGFLDENVVGEPLLLINVMSSKERDRIEKLSGDSSFHRIIDALYDLTRNPNGVNVANPGSSTPDKALLIGFTTKYTVRITNSVSPLNLSTQDFFGARPGSNNLAFLSISIVQEPLGDAPKALTAGLPVPPANGSFGNALKIDNGSYVEVGNIPAGALGNTVTFEAWVNPSSGGCRTILSRGDGVSSSTDFIFELGWDGATCGALRVGFYGAGNWDISAGTIPTNQWTHVAVTFNGTEKVFYINGILDRVAPRTGNLYQSGSPLYIGRQGQACNCNFLSGQLDDVRIWNVARSSSQIQGAWNKPLTGFEPNLLSYWRFDESGGTNALDFATGQYTGAFKGNATRVASAVLGGSGERYVVLAENNNPALGGLPVKLHVIRVFGGPFTGDLKVILPDNVFDERLTVRHSSDFGAEPDKLEFEWWYHPDNALFDPAALPTLNADGSIDDPKGWLIYTPALNPNKFGQNTITIGDSGETSQFTLADNWFISRYRGYNIGGRTNWSDWVGDPSSAERTRAALAPGWVKRVIEGLNPFEARSTNFHDTAASTYASMLIQAGKRYEGDIALNPSAENLSNVGLIEAYTTVLNRGKSLSIDGLPPVDSDPLNNALLLAASRISDLYMVLGNEAFADAQDPTIGFFSDSLEFGSLATATFAFKNQLDSLLEEELSLLRGRDDSAAGVGAPPIYNRLLWNFTGSEGEVAYERTYNIADVNLDGVIDEQDARILYPQGHGDAWGHYLTAVTTYYNLLRHPRFTWVPRTESVLVAGTAVRVDFLDERKFANAAAAKARAGSEIVDLTYRSKFVDDPEGQFQGYKDTRVDRAWGVMEWARRAGQGAYFDWLIGNAILPSVDPSTNHTGIQKIDRQTVIELDEIISQHSQVQAQVDKADKGLNPLGIAKGAVPFDIDPNFSIVGSGIQGQRHFQQIYDRAVKALNNCLTVWNQANQLSETLRRQQDDVDDFTANVAEQERDFKSRLIEIFGYPYAGDIGAGKTYPSGYDGPDMYHYMYVNATELTGAASVPTNIVTGFFTNFTDSSNGPSLYFESDLAAGSFSSVPILNVQFPLSQGGWAFSAPASYGARRAPGELQMALSDLLQEETRLKIALGNYDALIKNIQDAATLLRSRSSLATQTVSLLSNNRQALKSLDDQIKSAQDEQIRLHRASSIVNQIAAGIVETIPDSIDPVGVTGAIIKGVVLTAAVIISQSMEGVADGKLIEENDHQRSKEQTQLQTDLQIETANQEYEVRQQAAELLAMLRDEATLRLEAMNQAELVRQTLGRYQAALASGQRLLDERTAFRQRTAGTTQQNRYKDMAFRIFRNEALQKYRAQFDLAARYVYLAATAYDYELNFLGTDNRAGRNFFTDIIRQRSLGQIIDGDPVAGGSGLADALGRLNQNFLVLESRFGLNNPQFETAQFSLRKELFRIRDASDGQWRSTLRQAVIHNLWDVPEFRRYCRPFAPESAGPQPGLVIRFPTTVTFGLNFFGEQLGGGDSAYDASLFATKINSAGVWFSDYNGAGLSTTPRVYLVPAGMDVQRSPTGNTQATREWKVIDQVIPVPFPIGASALSDPNWIPMNDSLAESFAQIRRFASFRAYHDAGDYDPAETTSDTRLIGRSVWNTDWMLIIPGGTFLANPDQGLEAFINSISDIKVSLQSYSYSGD